MTIKKFKCNDCQKVFVNKKGRQQHWNATDCIFGHGSINEVAVVGAEPDNDFNLTFEQALELADDDLPDGAYFAMAHDLAGLDYGDGFDQLIE